MGFARSGPPIEDPEEGPQYTLYADVPPLERSWKIS
jgi:hypothetical protein